MRRGDDRAGHVRANDRNDGREHVIELVDGAAPVVREVGLVPHLPILDVVLHAVALGRTVRSQRGHESREGGAAVRVQIFGNATRPVFRVALACIATGNAGDEAGNMAEGEDDRGRLMLRHHVEPGVEIGPVVSAAASLKNRPRRSCVPQARGSGLRLACDPDVVGAARAAADAFEAEIGGLNRMTLHRHRSSAATRVRQRSDSENARQAQRSEREKLLHRGIS